MDFNPEISLRSWAKSLEDALDISIGMTDEGAFVMQTAGGANVGIEPVPNQRALVLTGELGAVDDTATVRWYQSLLVVNFTPALTGTGFIGMEPQTRQLVLRLPWSPPEDQWHEESFLQLLALFARHVDQLAPLIATPAIENVLNSAAAADAAAAGSALTPSSLA